MLYEAQTGLWRLLSLSGAARTTIGLADALLEESGALAAAGRGDEACAKADEAVALIRDLDQRPRLARFLAFAADRHRFAGRPGAATLLDEALALVRDADGPEWGPAVWATGLALWLAGRQEEARAASRRAVDLLRGGPPAELGTALIHLGFILRSSEQFAEALTVNREAVEILARAGVLHTVRHTDAQVQLALTLGALGRYQEALSAAREPLELFGTAAKVERGIIATQYGGLLKATAHWHSELEEPDEALTAARRAIALFRRLIGSGGAGFADDLADLLTIEARQLHRLGRDSEAVPPLREAVEICRGQAGSRRRLVHALVALADRLWDLSQRAESVALSREVVGLLRRLALDDRDTYEPELAVHLEKLAERAGEPDHLLAAVALARELADRDPDRHAGLRCDLLMQHAERLDLPEQIVAFREAVELTRPYAHTCPLLFVMALINLTGASDGAETAPIEEAVALLRPMPERRDLLVQALIMLAAARAQGGRPAEAADALAELAVVVPGVADDDPEAWDFIEEILEMVRDAAPEEVARRGLAEALRRP